MTAKFSIAEKLNLITWYYTDKFRSAIQTLRDLSVTNPKAWHKSLWNLYGMGEAAGVQVSHDSALNNAAVYNAVTIISGTIGSLPLNVYKKRKDGGKDIAINHPLNLILHKKPNPYMAAMNYREAASQHMLTWGNSYSEISRERLTDKISELFPITPHRVKPKWQGGAPVYEIDMGGAKPLILPKEKILHIPGLGYDGIVGYSVINRAREAIGLTKATERYGAKYFENGTHLGVVLSHPNALGEEGRQNLQQSLKKYHSLTNAHKTLILEEGMTVDKLGIPPDEAQFLQSRKFQVTDIARWFNIPPHMLKDLERATFSNIEHQSIDFVVHTIRPWLTRIEQNYDIQLLTEKELRLGYYCKHKVEGLLRGDAQARASFYNSLFQLGALSPNDIRELEDLNPIDGGDQYFIPLNMGTIDQVVNPPEPEPAQQDEGQSQDNEDERGFWQKILEDNKTNTRMIEDRAIVGRDRINNRFFPLVKEKLQNIVNREANHVKKILDKNRNRGKNDIRKWLKKFYEQMPEYIRGQLFPVFQSFMDAIMEQAANEIDLDPDDIKDFGIFVREYTETYAKRHLSSSVGQINQLLNDADEYVDEIETRMDEWRERRADKGAINETVKASNAVAQMVYFTGGYAAYWRIRGAKTCPYCTSLAGQKVAAGESFFQGGEEHEPQGAENGPMIIRGLVQHPPLHQGCDCYISFR
jgi:HK97 family phage portal protein